MKRTSIHHPQNSRNSAALVGYPILPRVTLEPRAVNNPRRIERADYVSGARVALMPCTECTGVQPAGRCPRMIRKSTCSTMRLSRPGSPGCSATLPPVPWTGGRNLTLCSTTSALMAESDIETVRMPDHQVLTACIASGAQMGRGQADPHRSALRSGSGAAASCRSASHPSHPPWRVHPASDGIVAVSALFRQPPHSGLRRRS